MQASLRNLLVDLSRLHDAARWQLKLSYECLQSLEKYDKLKGNRLLGASINPESLRPGGRGFQADLFAGEFDESD